MEELKEFLKNAAKCEENDSINYRANECGRLIESIPFSTAIEMLKEDLEEMREFMNGFDLFDEKIKAATFSIWKKHIAVFK